MLIEFGDHGEFMHEVTGRTSPLRITGSPTHSSRSPWPSGRCAAAQGVHGRRQRSQRDAHQAPPKRSHRASAAQDPSASDPRNRTRHPSARGVAPGVHNRHRVLRSGRIHGLTPCHGSRFSVRGCAHRPPALRRDRASVTFGARTPEGGRVACGIRPGRRCIVTRMGLCGGRARRHGS